MISDHSIQCLLNCGQIGITKRNVEVFSQLGSVSIFLEPRIADLLKELKLPPDNAEIKLIETTSMHLQTIITF